MKPFPRLASSTVVFGVGALVGAWAGGPATRLAAQAPADEAPVVSEATAEKIKSALSAVTVAQATLEQDGLYRAAVKGPNSYAVFSGGLDAVADLESGRGVDPVTFAGLHAGSATDEIAPQLGFDANGRLTYRGKLVRIYSIERMKLLAERQAAVSEASAGGRRRPGS